MQDTKSVFELNSTQYIEIIDRLELERSKASYSFMVVEDFEQLLREEPANGVQIYWSEILARAHLTAVVAILRSRRWIDAIVAAANDGNMFSFSAAFRGFIESSADTLHALGGVAFFLSENHLRIKQALAGKLEEQFFTGKEIEDALIHFKYARHLSRAEMEAVPPSHRAMQVRQYMEGLEKGKVPKVVACYEALCDFTHPGASSVWMWLASKDGINLELNPNQDEAEISYFLTEYGETLQELVMFAFTPAFLVLNVLNYFPVRTLHTSALLGWDLSGIQTWQKCLGKLGSSRALAL